MTTRSIIAKFTSTEQNLSRCYHTMSKYLYVGTGTDGIVYRTVDGFDYSEFYKTGDKYVTAIADYGNALFAGTSPNGRIMMHNFNTANRFHYVTTGDYQVTAFTVHDDKLYAGTSPSGMIFSFDGSDWTLEYDAYGGGIKSLVSYGDSLYVFVDGFESIPVLTGGKWGFLQNGSSTFSISSFSKSTTTIDILETNKNFDASFSCADTMNGVLYFAPGNRCNLYAYDGSSISIVNQWDGEMIRAISPIGDKQLMVAVDNMLYVAEVE